MNKNSKLKELLDSDMQARRFYDSLSDTLKKRFDSSDTSSFLTLMKAAELDRPANSEKKTIPHIASSTENTGMIPEGADHSANQWKRYGGLSQ